jgi:DNA-binding response OmpR family regulator
MSQTCILLVEADLLVRSALADYLRECGYHVLEAFDAAEARQLLAHGARQIGVVLADVDAPGENGFAFAAWVRSHHAGVRVILAGTVARAAENAGDLCEDGPALSKPYEHHRVLDHIRRLLAARDRNGGG